eukprot:2995810-Prymnesium_polylepis.1
MFVLSEPPAPKNAKRQRQRGPGLPANAQHAANAVTKRDTRTRTHSTRSPPHDVTLTLVLE